MPTKPVDEKTGSEGTKKAINTVLATKKEKLKMRTINQKSAKCWSSNRNRLHEICCINEGSNQKI